jgi:predicted DNA-binding transcriptional regulator AlpA
VRETDALLDLARVLPAADLPEFLGAIERVRVTALARLTAPVQEVSAGADRLVGISEAAERLACSTSYLYRNADRFPFTRRRGRRLVFSSNGISTFIQKSKASLR